jgi:hypothetical protein
VTPGTQASGSSSWFLCRGTDELLGVMDKVTIINSTLGKALGGASGTYMILSLVPFYPHAGPWEGVRKGRWGGQHGQYLERVMVCSRP